MRFEKEENPPLKGESEHDECRVNSGDVHPSRLKADSPQVEISTFPGTLYI